MVPAEFISLSGCLSYNNVRILLPEEYDTYGVQPALDYHSLMFIYDGCVYEVHQYNINVIKLDSNSRTGNCPTAHLTISDEMQYCDAHILGEACWKERGIPQLLDRQFAFSDNEGTYICRCPGVTQLVRKKAERPMRTVQPSRPHRDSQKQSAVPVSKHRTRPEL